MLIFVCKIPNQMPYKANSKLIGYISLNKLLCAIIDQHSYIKVQIHSRASNITPEFIPFHLLMLQNVPGLNGNLTLDLEAI